MDEDNLYPLDGEAFVSHVPADQVKEAEEEQREVLTAMPAIQKILAHFDERIAVRDSIKSISVNIEENAELHQKTCAVNDMLADALREEKGLLEALLQEHDVK